MSLPILTKSGQKINERKISYELPFKDFLTKRTCKTIADSERIAPNLIERFIATYNINWRNCKKCENIQNVDDCVQQFSTLNDFFTREKSLKQLYHRDWYKVRNKNNYIVSPADARTLHFFNINTETITIKNQKISIAKMLHLTEKFIQIYYSNCHIIVSRLAPSDYHRVHSPIDGKFILFYEIKGKFIPIQSTAKSLFKNYRVVLFIKNPILGLIPMCLIGSFCVGSIRIHTNKLNKRVKKGEELGYFKFGGSTIVTLFPVEYKKNKLKIDSIILKHSKNNIETLLQVGEIIGQSTIKSKKRVYKRKSSRISRTPRTSRTSKKLKNRSKTRR